MILLIQKSVVYLIVMMRCCRLFSLILILLWLCILQSYSVAEPKEHAKEYQIKAVYLYNFTRFIRWPQTALGYGEIFQICILGKNPFQEILDYIVRHDSMNSRPIQVRKIQAITEGIGGCHILFISQSEQSILDDIFRITQNKPILTVSDIPNFINLGGMIKFYINRKRQVRLAIEPATLTKTGLKADANLLRISQSMSRHN